MRKINHERGSLRYLDNLRRELNRQPDIIGADSTNTRWPAWLRPVADSPAANKALSTLLLEMDRWIAESDHGKPFKLSDPPSSVLKAFEVFENARVANRYDNTYNGKDWLRDNSEDQDHPADFKEAFVALLRLGSGN